MKIIMSKTCSSPLMLFQIQSLNKSFQWTDSKDSNHVDESVGWGLRLSGLKGVASVGFAGSDVSGAVQSALVLERNSASSSAVATRGGEAEHGEGNQISRNSLGNSAKGGTHLLDYWIVSIENIPFDWFKRKSYGESWNGKKGLPASVSASPNTLLCAPGRGFALFKCLTVYWLIVSQKCTASGFKALISKHYWRREIWIIFACAQGCVRLVWLITYPESFLLTNAVATVSHQFEARHAFWVRCVLQHLFWQKCVGICQCLLFLKKNERCIFSYSIMKLFCILNPCFHMHTFRLDCIEFRIVVWWSDLVCSLNHRSRCGNCSVCVYLTLFV